MAVTFRPSADALELALGMLRGAWVIAHDSLDWSSGPDASTLLSFATKVVSPRAWRSRQTAAVSN